MNRRSIITSVAGAVGLVAVGAGITVGGLGSSGTGGGLMRVNAPTPITLRGEIGGEKRDFLFDPDTVNILKNKFGITLDVKVRGSMDMVQSPGKDADFLWPAHETAADIYTSTRGRPIQIEPIFNSPIVILSWQPIIDVLASHGMVHKTGDTWYADQMQSLLKTIVSGTSWNDFGMKTMYGPVGIQSTHPALSNSGLMFASLAATMLNNGRTPTPEDMDRVGPDLRKIFERMGRLEDSSGRIFRQFLTVGKGQFPMLIAYENQMAEYWQAAEERERKLISDQIRVIYPVPSIFATHPLIAITPNAKRLIEALRDPELRAISWEKHGFRVPGAESMAKPAAVKTLGLPETVDAITPMPSTSAVERMLQNYIPQN